MADKYDEGGYDSRPIYHSGRPANYDDEDVFGHEEGHDVEPFLPAKVRPSSLICLTDQIQNFNLASRRHPHDR
jgi:hypothetical protein